jgi:hypothetical protein
MKAILIDKFFVPGFCISIELLLRRTLVRFLFEQLFKSANLRQTFYASDSQIFLKFISK